MYHSGEKFLENANRFSESYTESAQKMNLRSTRVADCLSKPEEVWMEAKNQKFRTEDRCDGKSSSGNLPRR